MPCSRSFPVHPINTMEVDANTNSSDTTMKVVAMDFLTKKAYAPPFWASHIKSIPSHTFSLGQFPTPIHKWDLPNLPPNTEVWLKAVSNLVKEKLVKEGKRPYVIAAGGSNALGTWFASIHIQNEERILSHRFASEELNFVKEIAATTGVVLDSVYRSISADNLQFVISKRHG